MSRRVLSITITCGLAACAAMAAPGDHPDLYNPSFEEPGISSPALPQGWKGFNVTASDYVDTASGGLYARTGTRSIRLRPSAGPSTQFQGFSTDTFVPDGSDLYNPDYTYLGGDVHITGWYLVPDGETLANDAVVGIKLEFRREPPNFSVYTSFEFNVDQMATNGQWHSFEATVTDAMMLAVGDFPPYATSVTILPLRFFAGNYASDPLPTGTIYWDDLYYVQGDLPGGCNAADIAEPYNILDLADITGFIDAFLNQQDAADNSEPFGVWDLSDITGFVDAFLAGCP
ncbi:MAG: hypothetical protein H6810_03100 [Phycisphaeraceae bacterium]|nr:MAG: hypothetical protein H6810_03100 [Phycisphaeraceae bacterium]